MSPCIAALAALAGHSTLAKSTPRLASPLCTPLYSSRHKRLAMSTHAALKRVPMGNTDVMVTEVCLGTMTWGVQNTERDAHEQLDYAIKTRGINFIDTAEMYPVPSSAPGWVPGKTEEFIGTWIAKNRHLRKDLVLATKVSGYNPNSETGGNRFVPPKPKADCRLDRDSIRMACDASLRRLQTDYIDLYQLHWPDRYCPSFGSSVYDITKERPDSVPIEETVAALGELLASGKIKHYGLSNETTFGVCEFVRIADRLGIQRPATIQNSFCLLHRSFETELAEACAPSNFNIGLLPWTPLGGGALSGKYLRGAKPPDGRLTKYAKFQQRYINGPSVEATEKYASIAEKAGISLATLALAWCKTRFYVTSTIIGATTLAQLEEDIDAFDETKVTLSEETLRAIDAVHFARRDPCIIP